MAQHFFDDLLTAQALHAAFTGMTTVAQYRQMVADGFQFVDTVGNKHDADTFGAQAAHDVEQAFALIAV
ncbi:hypothetical protein D3C81_2232860 [compost metagenome]